MRPCWHASITQFSVFPRSSAALAGVKAMSSSSAAEGAAAKRSTAFLISVRRRMSGVSFVDSVGGARSFLVTGCHLMGYGLNGHVELFGVAVEGPVTCSLLAVFDPGEVAGVNADGFGEP